MSSIDSTFGNLLAGTPHFQTDLAIPVAARLKILGPIVEKEGDYCYDGNRCRPENLGWRFVQHLSLGDNSPTAIEVNDGMWDDDILATFHEAAGCEYYYRYEKDWGWND